MRQATATLFGLLLVAALALPARAEQWQTWSGRYTLPAGALVSVDNVQGSILVEGWDRSEAEVVVTKSAGSSAAELDEVEISVQADGRSLQVETLYHGRSDEPVVVNYRLRVPRQVRLQGLHTVNGSIEVRNVEGAIEARTLNGDIAETGVTGSVAARTLNGSVRVALRAVRPEAGIELESANGDLYLLLPPGANADLEWRTVAGQMESGLLLTASEVPGRNLSRGRLGRGGAQIRLRTIRGDIHMAENEGVL